MMWHEYAWYEELIPRTLKWLGSIRVSVSAEWPTSKFVWSEDEDWEKLITLDEPEWSKQARVATGLKQEGAWNE